jgi:adenine-specific DNA-methyltransferase
MDYFQQFKTVGAWRAALGFLPVHLSERPDDMGRWVLLNGTTGNFCLDFIGGVDPKSQRDQAWSCNVGHYVSWRNDDIVVTRWDKPAHEETYSGRSVVRQLNEFHRHLEKHSPNRSRSIVPHSLRVFRQIRTVVPEADNGLRSLRVFLHLLASAADGESRKVNGDLEAWGLNNEIVDSSNMISNATWESLHRDLSGIGRPDDLTPDFQLVLNHSSGLIFQDAHIEAQISSQLAFPGLESPAFVHSKATPGETGIYFTASALARTLAEEATRDIQPAQGRELILFDPACGSGELLKECLRLLQLQEYPGRVRVIGWDKSTASVDMSRFGLAWEKRAWPPGRVEIEIAQQDSLSGPPWPNAIDILIMNPPFQSWQRMDLEEKARVTQILGGSSNKPNLAMAFARLAVDALSDTGTLAMIVPNSLLEASSAKSVRSALSEALTPQLIARLGEQTVFARALVDAGMYVGKRRPSNDGETAILWTDSRPKSLNRALRGFRKWRDTHGDATTEEGYSVYHREDVGVSGAPWVARQYEAWATHESIKSTKLTMPAKRVFDIKQGVRLGNDVFIVGREYVQQLEKNESRFFRPAVMNLSISDASINDNYYVFYPYGDGLPDIQNEDDLAEHVPTYFKEFLEPAKPKLSSRKSLAEGNLNWWDLLRKRTWQTEPGAKIVSKYFGGQRSFAFDRTGQFVVVVGSAWLLEKGAIEVSITNEEIYFAYLAFLSSTVAYDLLKYVSIQVSGGQWDLSNKYTKNLLIPNLAKLEPAPLEELVQAGVKILEGKIEDWTYVDKVVTSLLTR